MEFLCAPKSDTMTSKPEPFPVWPGFCHRNYHEFDFAWGDLLGFPVNGWTEKIPGLSSAMRVSD